MQEAFANALQRGQGVQARCLGLNLQTLTVGHLFLLAEHDCAFPFRYEEAGLGDLVIGVLVCALPWRKAQRTVKTWWTPYFMRLWERFTRNQSKQAAAEAFQIYLSRELRAPATEGARGELKTPLPFRILVMLMADFHLTEEKAMDMPVKKAMCLWAAEGDRRGKISLKSDRVLDFEAWAAEQDRIWASQQSKEVRQ